MKIFTIVITFNGQKYVDKCFNSLVNSSVTHHRILAIDNGSSDNTLDIISENYPSVKIIEMNQNLGFGKANNIGIQIAAEENADYIFLLNQDAWVNYDTIENLVKAHKKHEEFGIISPVHLNINEELDYNFEKYVSSRYTPHLLSDAINNKIQDKIYQSIYINAAAWLIPISTIKIIGGFMPEFKHYGEDDNYIHRCHFHKIKVGIYPYVIIIHDRNQSPSPNSKLPYKKQKNYIYSHILVEITNINQSYKEKILKVINHAIKGLIRNPMALLSALISIIGNLKRIKRSIYLTKQMGKTFLK